MEENKKQETWNQPQQHNPENKKLIAGILAIVIGQVDNKD
jgi:hypothetical protein